MRCLNLLAKDFLTEPRFLGPYPPEEGSLEMRKVHEQRIYVEKSVALTFSNLFIVKYAPKWLEFRKE